MSVLFSAGLFYLSYMPLWIAVIWIDAKSIYKGNANLCTEYISIIIILMGLVVSGILVLVELHKKTKIGRQTYEIKAYTEAKMVVAEFMLSYILPLFIFDFTLFNQMLLFALFYVMLAYLVIRHKYFTVNIVLEILNYRFYDCELVNEDQISVQKIVMCKGELNKYLQGNAYFCSINNEYELAFEDKKKYGKQYKEYEI